VEAPALNQERWTRLLLGATCDAAWPPAGAGIWYPAPRRCQHAHAPPVDACGSLGAILHVYDTPI
jgi:hypothetical protein